jgi:Transglycosylase-like domain
VPFDIPVEAFAVEVGGGAHPSVRSLGDRRLVYVEHRRAVRRTYRRRQLFLAVGLSGAFVAVAGVALATGGHAEASAAGTTVRVSAGASQDAAAGAGNGGVAASGDGVTGSGASGHGVTGAEAPEAASKPVLPPLGRARRTNGSRSFVVGAAFDPFAGGRTPEDRDEDRSRQVSAPLNPLANDAFLACTRGYESIYAGGYRAVSPGGTYRGAYQFDQVTWNGTARHLHRYDLVGMRPERAAPDVQDLLAYTLYRWQGAGHWHGRCAGLT